MTTGKALTTKTDALAVSESMTGELETTGAMARELAEIQSAVIMARKFPRDEELARSKLLAACGRASFADVATYSFPRAGSTVSGPSVNIAREAARIWGNIRFGLDITREDDESRAIRGWAWDVETNTKVSYVDELKKLVQRKDKASGQTRWVTPDERDLRELTNRRGAICLRNCLLQLVPKDFIEDALHACATTLRDQAKQDKPTVIKKILASFGEFGVTTAMLGDHLGHPLTDLTEDEAAQLRGIYQALKDGVAQKEEYFSAGGQNKPVSGTLSENEQWNASELKTLKARHQAPIQSNQVKLNMDHLKPGQESEHQGHDAPPIDLNKTEDVTLANLTDGLRTKNTLAEIEAYKKECGPKLRRLKGPESIAFLNSLAAREDELRDEG